MGLCVMIVLFISCITYINKNKRYPFKNLQKGQVNYVSIYSLSAKQQIELSSNETEELVMYLNNVVLYGKASQEFLDYSGCVYRMFNIHFSDGTIIDISASNPFIIFNGQKGYKTDFFACKELTNFYYKLIDFYYEIE